MWCCAAGGTAHRRNGYRWVAAVAPHPTALNFRVHLNALAQSGRLDSGSACSATATKAAKPLAATHTLVITSQAHTPNLLQMQPPPQSRKPTQQGHPCCNTLHRFGAETNTGRSWVYLCRGITCCRQRTCRSYCSGYTAHGSCPVAFRQDQQLFCVGAADAAASERRVKSWEGAAAV